MEKTYIINNNDDIVDNFKFQKIDLPISDKKDSDLHDHICNLFIDNPEINKLIIPVKLGDSDYLGLKLALHIRLNQKIGDKVLIPILFYSERMELTGQFRILAELQMLHFCRFRLV